MGQVILKTEIPRREGMLYYCSTDSKGHLTVCETKMSRGGRRKKKASAAKRSSTKKRSSAKKRR